MDNRYVGRQRHHLHHNVRTGEDDHCHDQEEECGGESDLLRTGEHLRERGVPTNLQNPHCKEEQQYEDQNGPHYLRGSGLRWLWWRVVSVVRHV